MTLFRGSGEGLALHQWLTEVLWPMEAHLTADDVYWGMTLAAAELLRFGVTTSCEMYFHEEAVADAVIAAGGRAVVTPAVLTFDPDGGGRWWEQRIAEIADFHRRHNGQAGRIEVGFAPHAPYSVPLPALADVGHSRPRARRPLPDPHGRDGGRARPLRCRARLLGAEAARRGRRARGPGPRRPQHLALARGHDALRRYDVAVAHCPSSNAKLASGMAPVCDFLAAASGWAWAPTGRLPTTTSTSGTRSDCAPCWLGYARVTPVRWASAAAWALATRDAGLALGRPDLGVLAEGSAADMVVVDLDDPVFVPLLSDAQLVDHLVWSASSRLITDVWVAGRQVVADGHCLTVDVSQARREVETRTRRLRAAAG